MRNARRALGDRTLPDEHQPETIIISASQVSANDSALALFNELDDFRDLFGLR